MLPPLLQWLGPAAQSRIVLLLNHVVASEPEAIRRLQPHAGHAIDVRWRLTTPPATSLPLLAAWLPADLTPPPVRLRITPAGLFEAERLDEAAAPASGEGGLSLTIALGDPLSLARQAMRGERPEVRIEGDAALAEVASWLMKNLRWDVQDDLSRWLGGSPAEVLRALGLSVRDAMARWRSER
jgi:ubiquinone biosynthesis protein UbiJ